MNDLKGLAKSMGIVTPSWARDDELPQVELMKDITYPATIKWKNDTRRKTLKHFKKRGKCQRCQSIDEPTEFHHLDYDRFDVYLELCRKCHGIEHRKEIDSLVDQFEIKENGEVTLKLKEVMYGEHNRILYRDKNR